MHGPFILALWSVGAIALGDPTDERLCVQPSSACVAAIAEFTVEVQDYLRVREEAARGLPVEKVFVDPSELLAVRQTLRQRIREARHDARAGDLFPPRAAAAFRHIVAATAAAHRVDAQDFVRELRAERMPGAKQPVVNEAYDWRLGAWMWPTLLQALPPLPSDLQYRIVDDDLVIIDLDAGLVVDILDDAMAVDED